MYHILALCIPNKRPEIAVSLSDTLLYTIYRAVNVISSDVLVYILSTEHLTIFYVMIGSDRLVERFKYPSVSLCKFTLIYH